MSSPSAGEGSVDVADELLRLEVVAVEGVVAADVAAAARLESILPTSANVGA